MDKELATKQNEIRLENMGAVEGQRAMQQVQAQSVLAKKFPRDSIAAYQKIRESCKRQSLAKGALYSYPRGGELVMGPSIRLAECLAQLWGNLDFGITEISTDHDSSVVQSYCWDLETNVRQVKTFNVPHYRVSKKRGKTRLTDPRDIYEHIANYGARRLRACILGVIPGDVVEGAVDACKRTMQGGQDMPLNDRIKEMVVAFNEIGVSKSMIEERIKHSVDQLDESELVKLRGIFQSVRDGASDRTQWFNFPKTSSDQTQALNQGLRSETKSK